MPLYIKANAQIKLVTHEDLTTQEPGYSVVAYDSKRACHDFYQLNDEKQLLRFMLRKLNGKYIVSQGYHAYQQEHHVFDTMPGRKSPPPSPELEESSFFTEEEIAHIREQEAITPATKSPESSFNIPSELTSVQQQQLVHGQLTHIPSQTFFECMKSLTLMQLEAAIRADDTRDLTLSLDEETEVKTFRYTYLNPVTINEFSLVELDKKHPTIGQIYDYYVLFIKAYILQKAPVRANQLHSLQKLSQSGALKLGSPNPDFQNEGIHNPQGLTEQEYILFRALDRVIVTQNNAIDATIQLILNSTEFSSNNTKTRLLHLLDNILQHQVNPKILINPEYESIIRALDAVYQGLVDTQDSIFSEKLYMLYYELCNLCSKMDVFGQKTGIYEMYLKLQRKYGAQPHLFGKLLHSLNEAKLLSPRTFKLLYSYSDGSDACYFAQGLLFLLAQKQLSLTEATFQDLHRSNTFIFLKRPLAIRTLQILSERDLLNMETLVSWNLTGDLTLDRCIIILNEMGVLDRNLLDRLLKHPNSEEQEEIRTNLLSIYDQDIHDSDLFKSVIHYEFPTVLRNILFYLSNAQMLNSENIKTWINCQSKSNIGNKLRIIEQLDKKKVLVQDLYVALMNPDLPSELSGSVYKELLEIITLLSKLNFLTTANVHAAIKAVVTTAKTNRIVSYSYSLSNLSSKGLLTQFTFDLVINFPYRSDDFASIVLCLKKADDAAGRGPTLFTEENCRSVLHCSSYFAFDRALQKLQAHNWLDQLHLDLMFKRQTDHMFFAEFLIMLHQTEGMFTQENCDKLIKYPNLCDLSWALEDCQKAGVFDQAHFNRIIECKNLTQLRHERRSEYEQLFFKSKEDVVSTSLPPSSPNKPIA